jgi:hypothetical protein
MFARSEDCRATLVEICRALGACRSMPVSHQTRGLFGGTDALVSPAGFYAGRAAGKIIDRFADLLRDRRQRRVRLLAGFAC